MEKKIKIEREVQIMRLLELIKGAERCVEIGHELNDAASIKGHIRQKNEFVNELIELLNEELKIQVRLEEAA